MRWERSPEPISVRLLLGAVGLGLRLHLLEDLRLQEPHGLGLVLVLAPLVAAEDDDAGRLVREADGALGLVLVLAAGPAGTHHVAVDVLGPDHDLDVLGLGQDGHGGGRGVDAALGLGLGHALDAVAAGLELQVPERPVAADAEARLAVSAELGGHEFQGLELPAHRLGVAAVHLDEVAGEQGRLVAAGARSDLHDQPRAVGAGLLVVDQVAEGLAGLGFLLLERFKLGLVVLPRLGVGLGLDQGLRPRRSAGRAPGSGHRAAPILASVPRSLASAATRDGLDETSGSRSAASISRNRW